MKFNSQICTTMEQSERLLALGLQKETADIIKETTEVKNGVTTTSIDYSWSLHRLIEMMPKYVKRGNIHYERTLFPESVCYYKELYKDCGDDLISFDSPNLYDRIIDAIEWLIKNGYFPKEYVQHSENTREEGR